MADVRLNRIATASAAKSIRSVEAKTPRQYWSSTTPVKKATAMNNVPYVQYLQGVPQFRRAIPADVRDFFDNKRERVITLRGTAPGDIGRLAREYARAFDSQVTAARSVLKVQAPRELREEDFDTFAERLVVCALETDAWERTQGVTREDLREDTADSTAGIEQWREAAALGDYSHATEAMEDMACNKLNQRALDAEIARAVARADNAPPMFSAAELEFLSTYTGPVLCGDPSGKVPGEAEYDDPA